METTLDKYAYKREKTATSDPTETTTAPDDSSAYHLDLSEYISKYTMESCDNAFHRCNTAGDDNKDTDHTDTLHKADQKPVVFLKSRFEEEFIVVTNALYHQSRSAHVPIITHTPLPITTKATSTTTNLIGRSHSSYGRSRAKVHKDDDDDNDDDTSTACMRSQSASMRRIPSVHRGVQNSISSRIINDDHPTAQPIASWYNRSPEGDHSVGYIALDSNNWDAILPHRHMSNDPSDYPTSQQQPLDMILPTPSSVTESPRSMQPPTSSSTVAWNYTDFLTSHLNDRHNNNNSNKGTTALSLDSFNAPRQSHRMRGRKIRSGYSSYDFDLLRREKLTPTGTKVIFNPDLGDRSRDLGDHSRDLGDRSRDMVNVKYAPSLMLDGINDLSHLFVLDDDRDDDDGSSLAGALYNMKSIPSKKMKMTRKGRRKRK